MVLTIFSIFSGFLFNFFFNSRFEVFFENSIFISHFNAVPKIFYKFVPPIVHFFPLIVIAISVYLFLFIIILIRKEINLRLFVNNNFYRKTYLKNYEKYVAFFNKKFFIDDFYNFLALNVYKISYVIFKTIDKGLLEFLGPRGLTNASYKLSKNFNKTIAVRLRLSVYFCYSFKYFFYFCFNTCFILVRLKRLC